MKYFLLPLGCQMNLADAKRIEKIIEGMGFVKTPNEDEANLLGVIACSVRQKAVNRVYDKINKWNKRKDRERVLTFVSGCFLKGEEQKYLKLFDLTVKTQDTINLPTMILQYGVSFPIFQTILEKNVEKKELKTIENEALLKVKAMQKIITKKKLPEEKEVLEFENFKDDTNINLFWNLKANFEKDLEAFIPIQNGCDKLCSFCAVPYTRGKEVSRNSTEIINEFKSLLEKGFKVITLLGQNVNSYGRDKNEELNFNQLLDKIGEIADLSMKEVWIYFTSPHPKDFNDELIDIIAKHKSLAKQIHLPMQSGDNKLLFRMNRNHSMKKYERIIQKIKSTLKNATIFTDVIVGFSKESLEQFENTKKAMEKYEFNMAFIAIYSTRPGTVSSRWADDIPMDEKKED